MSEFTPWTKDEYIKQLLEDGRVFIAQRLEALRENDRLKSRVEQLEAVLRTYACNCGLERDWLCEDRETSSECGYRANKALEELK